MVKITICDTLHIILVGVMPLVHIYSQLTTPLPFWPSICISDRRFHTDLALHLHEQCSDGVPCRTHIGQVTRKVQLPVGARVPSLILSIPVRATTYRTQAEKSSSMAKPM